jgi:EmrB/QacA subfamily drug resistance transporter
VTAPATAAHRWILVATALAAFIATIMATAINVVLPSLGVEFGVPFATVQWVVLAYLLATIALVPIIGRLGDIFGKRRIFLLGHALYAIGSLLCALAPDAATLIAFRTLQGAGSAAMTALGVAILADVTPASQRGRAIGIHGALISAGVVLGPSLGGIVSDHFSWRWIFIAGVAIALLGSTLSARVIPPSVPSPRVPFDVAGALTLFSALLSFSLALTLGQGRGFGDPLILTLFLTAAALTWLFVRIEGSAQAPVVDLRIFRNADLTIGLLSGLTTFVAISGVIFLMPFYLGNVLRYPLAQIGVLMAIVPMVLVVMAPIAGSLSDRFGPRPVTVVAMLSLLLGYLLVGSLDAQVTPLGYVLRFLPVGLGMGLFQTPNNSAIMGAARRGASGVTGGLLTLTRFLGQVIGTVVLGSAWAYWTLAHGGPLETIDASSMPIEAQVAALQRVLRLVQGLIVAGLLLVLFDWLRGRGGAAR